MKKYALYIILVFCFITTFGQTSEPVIKRIRLYSCETGLIYEITTTEIALEGTWFVPNDSSKTFMRTRIDKSDNELFLIIASSILKTKGNEILYNHCVNDGFNFKIYLYGNSVEKKIFVGNYNDKRVDQLTSLFDKYLIKAGLGGISYKIGYGSKEAIEDLIKSQNSCNMVAPDDYKKYLLDNWCELN